MKTTEPRELNMDTIVALVRSKGVWAYVDQVANGIAAIYAGAHIYDPDGRKIHAAAAGPGRYGWDHGPSMGSTAEFLVNGDGDDITHTVDCARVGALTEHTIAALIIAQAALPIGTNLSDADAHRVVADTVETCGHGTWLATCREPHGTIRGSLPTGPVVPLTRVHEQFDALTPAARSALLDRVFRVMEYGPDGVPGRDWSPDTTMWINCAFEDAGVILTSPDGDCDD
jgi:hypothetical protein